MNEQKKIKAIRWFMVLLSLLIIGCSASDPGIKEAPCPHWGAQCQPQLPVNSWYQPKETNTTPV